MIYCGKCHALLEFDRFNTGLFAACPACHAPNQVWLFPAAAAEAENAPRPENLIVRDDAGCFYHPSKQAVAACESCGRFLCSLCDVEMDGKHICFTCMSAGREKKTIQKLETHRFLYDALAVRIAFLPVIPFLWFLSFIAAPVALFISIRHWNSPSSIVPRKKKLRFAVAILLSLIQIAGWIGFIYFLITRKRG